MNGGDKFTNQMKIAKIIINKTLECTHISIIKKILTKLNFDFLDLP